METQKGMYSEFGNIIVMRSRKRLKVLSTYPMKCSVQSEAV